MFGTGQEEGASGSVDRRPLLHLLAGVRLHDLVRILAHNGKIWPRGYLQISVMLTSALLRAPSYTIEALRVADRVKAASFDPPPVFIVGHWRSGTTFLHNLISRDPNFCYPTIVDTLRPYDSIPIPWNSLRAAYLCGFFPRSGQWMGCLWIMICLKRRSSRLQRWAPRRFSIVCISRRR